MPHLNTRFRKAFISYLKNPHHVKNKANLINAAYAIYENALALHGLAPDQYLTFMHPIIKESVNGIKVNPTAASTLDGFIRELSFSDLPRENQAFHALNLAFNLTSPKKSCLRDIAHNFLVLQDKLTREDAIVTQRNHTGSYFLNNLDVRNIRAKKSMIDNFLKQISADIFQLSRADGDKFLPINYDVDQQIEHIEKHIDTLSEKQCAQILSSLMQKTTLILNAVANPDDIKDNADSMKDSGKRSALMVHSFNDKWFFTFLSKLIKTIKEALGMKTSAEKILENSVNEAILAGVALG